MDKIYKTCKIHGELTLPDVYIYKQLDDMGNTYIKQMFCKRCKTDSNRKWRKTRPDTTRDYAQRNADKIKARLLRAKYYKRNVKKLTDGYVKNVLHSNYGVPINAVPDIAIPIKREALRLWRQGYCVQAHKKALDDIFRKMKHGRNDIKQVNK